MAKILRFPEKEEQHISGKAQCIQCGHKWVAVAPVGVYWLKCPECKTMKGAFTNVCEPANRVVWTCSCGSSLMYATPHGIFCYNCAQIQVFG